MVLMAGVKEGEKGEHREERGDGEDVDGGGGFLSDGDLLMGYVVADREGLLAPLLDRICGVSEEGEWTHCRYAYPAWQ